MLPHVDYARTSSQGAFFAAMMENLARLVTKAIMRHQKEHVSHVPNMGELAYPVVNCLDVKIVEVGIGRRQGNATSLFGDK